MKIHAEIHADSLQEARDLARIAQRCAVDLGLVLPVDCRGGSERSILIQSDAEALLELNSVYCLLCHLSCFCPGTRVSLLIQAQDAFRAKPATRRRAASA